MATKTKRKLPLHRRLEEAANKKKGLRVDHVDQSRIFLDCRREFGPNDDFVVALRKQNAAGKGAMIKAAQVEIIAPIVLAAREALQSS